MNYANNPKSYKPVEIRSDEAKTLYLPKDGSTTHLYVNARNLTIDQSVMAYAGSLEELVIDNCLMVDLSDTPNLPERLIIYRARTVKLPEYWYIGCREVKLENVSYLVIERGYTKANGRGLDRLEVNNVHFQERKLDMSKFTMSNLRKCSIARTNLRSIRLSTRRGEYMDFSNNLVLDSIDVKSSSVVVIKANNLPNLMDLQLSVNSTELIEAKNCPILNTFTGTDGAAHVDITNSNINDIVMSRGSTLYLSPTNSLIRGAINWFWLHMITNGCNAHVTSRPRTFSVNLKERTVTPAWMSRAI